MIRILHNYSQAKPETYFDGASAPNSLMWGPPDNGFMKLTLSLFYSIDLDVYGPVSGEITLYQVDVNEILIVHFGIESGGSTTI